MKIVILDTQCSNMFSLMCSIKRLGYIATVSTNAEMINQSDKLFIPGVGTAKTAMKSIYDNNLFNTIRQYQKPVLGICLGMQLLCKISEENNGVKMLKLINENVKKMLKYKNISLPHTGWNKVYLIQKEKIFKEINNGSYFYFTHNFNVPICSYTTSKSFHGNYFSASIKKKNFYGVQFHPEKSGTVGEKLIKNFLEI